MKSPLFLTATFALIAIPTSVFAQPSDQRASANQQGTAATQASIDEPAAPQALPDFTLGDEQATPDQQAASDQQATRASAPQQELPATLTQAEPVAQQEAQAQAEPAKKPSFWARIKGFTSRVKDRVVSAFASIRDRFRRNRGEEQAPVAVASEAPAQQTPAQQTPAEVSSEAPAQQTPAQQIPAEVSSEAPSQVTAPAVTDQAPQAPQRGLGQAIQQAGGR
jgi:hypothetical protein